MNTYAGNHRGTPCTVDQSKLDEKLKSYLMAAAAVKADWHPAKTAKSCALLTQLIVLVNAFHASQ